MAENIERRLEQFVPAFEQLISLGIFTKPQMQIITKKRRAYEISLLSKAVSLGTYRDYVKYEESVAELTKRNKEKLGIDSTDRLIADDEWPKHIHSIYRRAIHKFPTKIEAWNWYIEYCQKVGADKSLKSTFAEALHYHAMNPQIYMQMAKFEMSIGDEEQAMDYLYSAIRNLPTDYQLYSLLCDAILQQSTKIQSRREVQGIEEPANIVDAPLEVFKAGLEDAKDKDKLLTSFIEIFEKYELAIDDLLDLAENTNDPLTLSIVAQHSKDPIKKYTELLEKKPTDKLRFEFCKFAQKKPILIEQIPLFENPHRMDLIELLINNNCLEEALDLVDKKTFEGKRTRLLILARKYDNLEEFEKNAKEVIKGEINPDLISSYLALVSRKIKESEDWAEKVRSFINLLNPDVCAKILRVTELKGWKKEANELADLMIRIKRVDVELYRKVIEMKKQTNKDPQEIRNLYQTVCMATANDSRIWLDFADFEYGQRNWRKLDAVRSKAITVLKNPTPFIQEYTERFCKENK